MPRPVSYLVIGCPRGGSPRILGAFRSYQEAWDAVARLAVRETHAMTQCERFEIREQVLQ